MQRAPMALGFALLFATVVAAQESKPTGEKKAIAAVPLMVGGKDPRPLSLQEKGPDTPGMKSFTEVNTEWRKLDAEFMKRYTAAKTTEERAEVAKSEPPVKDFLPKYWAVAEKDPADPGALRALYWIYTHGRGGDDDDKAIDMIAKHHAMSADIADFLSAFSRDYSAKARGLFETISEKHSDSQTRAKAVWYGAEQQLSIAQLLGFLETAEPKDLENAKGYYGAETIEKYQKIGKKKFEDWALRDIEKVKKDFSDVMIGQKSLGSLADDKLFLLKNLAIGCEAPEIVGEDVEGVAFKLSDYRGKVVVLDFWGFW